MFKKPVTDQQADQKTKLRRIDGPTDRQINQQIDRPSHENLVSLVSNPLLTLTSFLRI